MVMADAVTAGPAGFPSRGEGRTLWIHIGGPGTGTTILQQFLSRNRAFLKKRGILYPGTRESHENIGKEVKNNSPPTIRSGARFQLHGILDEMQGPGWHTCIISAESLAGEDGGASVLRELVPTGISVKVVYYAMRQDRLIESWYNHIVESPHLRYEGKLDDNLVSNLSRLLDHAKVIRPWADTFGVENIILRCYEKEQMNGGILLDFSRLIGLSPDSSLQIPTEPASNMLNAEHTEFLRLCNIRLKDKPEIHSFLLSEFRSSRLRKDQPGRHLLSPGKRREVLEKYGETNREVARNLLHREDGRLFYEPWPVPDESWEPFICLSVEGLVPVITELFYDQARWERPGQPLQGFLRLANILLKKVPDIVPSRGWDGSPTAIKPGPALQAGPEPPMPRTIEEMVPMVAENMYKRRQRAQERQPLAAVFAVFNHFLKQVVASVPPEKQMRIYRRLYLGKKGSRYYEE